MVLSEGGTLKKKKKSNVKRWARRAVKSGAVVEKKSSGKQ